MVIFGNNSSVTTSLAARLNDSLSAIVVPDADLSEDLIAARPLLDLGYDVHLSSKGSYLSKEDKVILPILQQGNKFLININALQCLSASTTPSPIHDKVMRLHRQMGHPSMRCMVEALESGTWITDVTSEQVKETMSQHKCNACVLAKKGHLPIPQSTTDPKTLSIADIISGDIIGPISPPTAEGHRYFFLFVDRRSSYLHVFTSGGKENFLTSLKTVYDFYKNKGFTINTFRSDSEKIMIEGKVKEYLSNNNVYQQTSLPYQHYQNLSERHVQTIVRKVATSMLDKPFLNATFWNYSLFDSVFTWNNTPNTKTDGKSPTQMINNNEVAFHIQRYHPYAFGTPVAAHNPDLTWRFDAKRDVIIITISLTLNKYLQNHLESR